MKRFSYLLLSLLICLLASCSKKTAKEQINELPPIFPDYADVTIPVNIAPMNFEIKDATSIRADFAIDKEQLGTVTGDHIISISMSQWHKWIKKAAGKNIDVTVSAWTSEHPNGIQYQPFSWKVSTDSIDAYIAYRLIEPGYESWQDIGLFQRKLASFDETAMVTNKQNNGGCLNCHSFQDYNPNCMLFHARGKGGGTVFWKNGQVKKVDMSQTNLKMKGVYPMWHKDGRFVVFSSNSTSQSFYNSGKTPIEVYDMKSDIFIYDTETGKEIADPRFCGEGHFETFPAFSPDGKDLYLCSADSVNLDSAFFDLRYSIIRVPFNANDGTLGEQIDTIYNAKTDLHSASFPRISPDGRFIMYTLADFATFPIWHREADLKMVDLTTGEEKDTTPINSPETESYHSWSSNGHWVVISSRRIDSRYTRLFFAHMNDDGSFDKPFLLPQKNPDENAYRLKSYNVPEYIKAKATLPKEPVTTLFK